MQTRRSGPYFSEGTIALWRRAAARGLSQGAIARAVGAERASTVSKWFSGNRRPRLEYALRLKRLLGIPLESWHAPADAVDLPLTVDDAA